MKNLMAIVMLSEVVMRELKRMVDIILDVNGDLTTPMQGVKDNVDRYIASVDAITELLKQNYTAVLNIFSLV